MLDDKDIEKLQAFFATKDDLRAVRDDLDSKMNDILTAIDAYSVKAETCIQETVFMGHQLNRHERWIEELAAKVGHELKS